MLGRDEMSLAEATHVEKTHLLVVGLDNMECAVIMAWDFSCCSALYLDNLLKEELGFPFED